MKKILLFICTILTVSFFHPVDTISEEERNFAVKFLTASQDRVASAVSGLSDAQLFYKPAGDGWSIEECARHIAAAETQLWTLTEGVIKREPNPAARADIKSSDEQIIRLIENRSQKVKAPEMLWPGKTPFRSATEALDSFAANRAKLIEYVKTTREDLRKHVSDLPVGKLDSYQMILYIGGHSNRHAKQIDEVKAHPDFPKN